MGDQVDARPAGLAEFDRAWQDAIEQLPAPGMVTALAGLTRLGERPASLARLANIIGRSTTDTRKLCGEYLSVVIDEDTIRWDPPFPGDETRRTLYVGDREIPMRCGCAPDLFAYAAVLDSPFRVEETCPVTGRTIHVDFVPGGYRRVDPPGTVTVLLPPQRLLAASGIFVDIDHNVCAHQPFYASTQAARSRLTARHGSWTFTVAEMFRRPFVTYLHDHLRPLIHPVDR
ncbi:MAG TPA: organomercurial lyase [Pseudonocardiaceae bacterium]|jgi:hypothetical protein